METINSFNALSARCPAREILARVADKWTVLVLSVLSKRTTRFNELRRKVDGITQKVLTDTLRDLERLGLVSRRIYAEVPPRVEYSLTPLGTSLVTLIDQVKAWTETHAPEVLKARQRYETQKQKQAATARRPA